MAENAREAGKLGVFISYSRDDLLFADQLDLALELAGFDPKLDRQGIQGAEDWQEKLSSLIREADTVIFVLSPSSARSETCAWEVAQAVEFGKRIIPVACRPLDGVTAPRPLAALNFIYTYAEERTPGTGYRSGMTELIRALKTDLGWLREHTRYLQRAIEWDAGQRKPNRLLSGADIAQAKEWLARQPKEAPQPTVLHLDFIKASEAWEAEQQSDRKRQLEEREALVRRAEQDRSEREAAQQRATDLALREARQARRVAQRTMIGLVSALLFAAGAGAAMLFARHQATLNKAAQVAAEEAKARALDEAAKARAAEKQVRAYNARLSTKMKLMISISDQERIEISENWYRLATTNAASVVVFHSQHGVTASGFLVRASDLRAEWGDELVVLTAEHVIDGIDNLTQKAGVSSKLVWVTMPGVEPDLKLALKEVIWRAGDFHLTTEGSFRGVDAAVLRLAVAPPDGAVPVRISASYDLGAWPKIANPSSRLIKPVAVTLLSIGYVSQHGLTLGISRALGRNDGDGPITKVFYRDASGKGGSGTPVFDADTGVLVALEQMGDDTYNTWAGGVPITAVREAVRQSFDGRPSDVGTPPRR